MLEEKSMIRVIPLIQCQEDPLQFIPHIVTLYCWPVSHKFHFIFAYVKYGVKIRMK